MIGFTGGCFSLFLLEDFWKMSSTWDEVTAICTGVAAIATAVMAGFTWKAIKDSQKQHFDLHQQGTDAQVLSEKHHQNSFRPIVVVSPYDGVDPVDRSGILNFDGTARTGNTRLIFIYGLLKNVGVGPALVVRLHLRAMETKDYGSTHELSPLQLGEARGGVDAPLKLVLQVNDAFNETDFALASGTLWELVIEYEDVFGNRFRTTHAKNSQRPWTLVEKV
ncbi:hypothetical protein [Dyella sp. EPa41]|uniref:hypothetical protein n=1 Tax=Dyella sp. EPa41 TaxID=1561194 RepID=UPI001915184F|nr:hypothetical protein [Dyella sp. EPa41]